MNEHRVELLDALGAEFRRVAAEHHAAVPRTLRGLRPMRLLWVALAALVLAGGAVATLSVREDEIDITGLLKARDRTTIAEGTTVAGSHWTLTTGWIGDHHSFCLSLAVVGTRGPESSAICGPPTRGGAMAPGHFGMAAAQDSAGHAGLLFGTVPDKAATVAVRGRTFSQQVETIDDDVGIPGRFYVIGSADDFRRTTIVFRDAAGRLLHKPDTVWHLMRWELRGERRPVG